MAERPNTADRKELAAAALGAAEACRALIMVLRQETAHVRAGTLGELRGTLAEKPALQRSLARCVVVLDRADWDVVLALDEGRELVACARMLAAAIRDDMGILQQVLAATDRIVRIIGAVGSRRQAQGYDPEGRPEAVSGGAVAVNDRI